MWPWVLVTAVLAFGVMVAAFRPSTTTEGLPFDSSFGLVSEWANVDEPAKLAEVETGNLNIVMSDINTCHVGQDWGECINANIDEYNKVCVGLSLSDSAKRLCEDYEAVIVDMQNRGGAGWTVTTLGGWGGLSTEAETKLDSIPAVSHVAVCYFGLFGECS